MTRRRSSPTLDRLASVKNSESEELSRHNSEEALSTLLTKTRNTNLLQMPKTKVKTKEFKSKNQLEDFDASPQKFKYPFFHIKTNFSPLLKIIKPHVYSIRKRI